MSRYVACNTCGRCYDGERGACPTCGHRGYSVFCPPVSGACHCATCGKIEAIHFGADRLCYETDYSAVRKRPTTAPQPHKHAALIKAWADGAQIEVRVLAGAGDGRHYEWHDDMMPAWVKSMEYRVKPAAPDYGTIGRAAWYGHSVDGGMSDERWKRAADAVIRAFCAQHKIGGA